MGVVTKGKAGLDDFELYDGRNTTFTRPDSAGGTRTINKVNTFVDVLQVYGGGTSYTRTTLNTANIKIGSSSVRYVIRPGTWTIDDNITFPANITVEFERGAIFDIASGKTATFNGPIILNGGGLPFSGAGSYVLSANASNSAFGAVASYTQARALGSSTLTDGQIVTVTDDGIAGDFVVKTGTVTDNGGTLIVLTDDPNRYLARVFEGRADSKWFGAKGDGATNDAASLQNWLNSGLSLHWSAGKYFVSASSAQALNVATYNFGDPTLKACLIVTAGSSITTEGTETQLIINDSAADTCGVAVAEDTGGSPSAYSQIKTTIGLFMIRANGASGRYGVVTPANASIFADKRPRYEISVHSGPPPGSDNTQFIAYGWDKLIKLGDTIDSKISYSGYGTYNATIDDAGQHQMTGLSIQSVSRACGVDIKFKCANMRTFFDGGQGLEEFFLTEFQGEGCWEGVTTTNSTSKPGGFIDNGHIKANKNAYSIKNRSSLQIGSIDAYRDPTYYDHGAEWNGLALDNSDVCGKSITISHGSALTKTGTNAIKAINGSTYDIKAINPSYVENAYNVDNCPDCISGTVRPNNVDVIHKLTGASTLDYTGGGVMVRAGSPVYFTTDGAVDKKRLRFPRNSGITVRTYQEITISAAGTTTIKPRETATEYDITMSAGTGAFTYDLILNRASAVLGDVVRLKIIGSSSTNPTLRICDNSASTVLSSFNSLGGSSKVAEYRLNESGNWVEHSVVSNSQSKITILAYGSYTSGTYSFPGSRVWDDFESILVVADVAVDSYTSCFYTRDLFMDAGFGVGDRLHGKHDGGGGFAAIQYSSTTQFAVVTSTYQIQQVIGWLK